MVACAVALLPSLPLGSVLAVIAAFRGILVVERNRVTEIGWTSTIILFIIRTSRKGFANSCPSIWAFDACVCV